MNTDEITNDDIRRALLGVENKTPDEDLEVRIFSESTTDGMPDDGIFAERLSALADEMVDDYLRGDLSSDECARFEEGYLRSREGRERLVFSTALNRFLDLIATPHVRLDRDPEPVVKPRITWLSKLARTPVWTLAHAALVLFAVAGAAWMFVAKLDLESRIGQMAADRVMLEKEIASLSEARKVVPSSVATALLAPGLLRGPGELERVIVPEGSELIRFQLDLGIDDYESYRAALHDADGDEIWTQSKLRASESDDTVTLTLTLPSELLPHGDYYFRVSGVTRGGEPELVGRYHFRTLVQ